FIAIGGLGQMMHTASTNTILQLSVDDDKRGRVMRFYTVCLQGTMPFGSLVAGAIAGALGGPWAMALMGQVCLLGTLFFRVRNIRSRMDRIHEHHHHLRAKDAHCRAATFSLLFLPLYLDLLF